MSSSKTRPPDISWDFRLAFPVLVAARLLLSLTSLPEILQHEHQLSSPLTSYSNRTLTPRIESSPLMFCFSVQEGIYLYKQGVDPYSGGVFRHVCALSSREIGKKRLT